MNNMKYFYYERNDAVLKSDAAIPPRLNGEEGVEISYSKFVVETDRINSKALQEYEAASAVIRQEIAARHEKKVSILMDKLGLSREEAEVFFK